MLTLIFHSISLKVVWTSATETKTELLIAPVSICTPEDYILTLLRPRKCTAAWFTVCHYCIPLPLVIGLILLDILIGELTHYICNARLFTFLLRFFSSNFYYSKEQATKKHSRITQQPETIWALHIYISRLKVWITLQYHVCI